MTGKGTAQALRGPPCHGMARVSSPPWELLLIGLFTAAAAGRGAASAGDGDGEIGSEGEEATGVKTL
eukprot:5602286-Pyramimonas_sp.AAC.1